MNDPRLRRSPLGFLEVINRPSPDDLSAYYADNYYQSERSCYRRSYTAEENRAIDLRIDQRAARAQTLLGRSIPGRLLDVGCGEGFVLNYFESRGWSVSGLDFSISGVEAMNPKMLKHVLQGDLFELLNNKIASNETFDLVWIGNVLEHVLDPIGLLAALRRLLVPGGILVVTVPNDGSAYQEDLLEAGLIDRRFWITIPDHLSYFCADSLRAIAFETGWEMLDILGDFPIDLFLSHPGSNYVLNPELGSAAHIARLRIEALIAKAGVDAANRFYSSLAEVGLGRNLTAFLKPSTARDVAP